MITLFSNISWGAAHNILWGPLFLYAIVLVFYHGYKQRNVWRLLAQGHIILLRNVSYARQKIRIILCMTGIIALFLAFLRPQWNKLEEVVMQEGRDVYIGLDVSKSMLAVDCKPNRLEHAKQKIKTLLSRLSCERVGLILFSGSAFVQCPLTSDYSAFYIYLNAVNAELISSGTTAIDKAVQVALSSFGTIQERKNKLLVLFTDGEDFSHNLAGVKKEAVEQKLSIFTIGVGSLEGAPVPLFDAYGVPQGHQKDTKGSIVISRLNEGILHTLSLDAGGKYIRSTDNDEDVSLLVKEIQARQKEIVGEQKHAAFEEQYHYFVLFSFICFIFEWLL
jgi:Ca-activated chloride channel homolog